MADMSYRVHVYASCMVEAPLAVCTSGGGVRGCETLRARFG